MPDSQNSDYPGISDQALVGLLISIERDITPILERNLLNFLTDHSIRHSKSVIRNAWSLTKQNQLCKLSDLELFILYAACLTHDLGQCWERIWDIKVWGKGESAWNELPLGDQKEWVRSNHAEISAELVHRCSSIDPPLRITLNSEFHPGLIAALCECHTVWLPDQQDLYDNLMVAPGRIRMRLLAALLRCGDILDETCGRAPRQVQESLNLDLQSKVHWWRHNSTRSIDFHHQDFTIYIEFEFADSCKDEAGKIVPSLSVPPINEELSRQRRVLAEENINWFAEPRIIGTKYGDVNEPIPNDVLSEMYKIVDARKNERLSEIKKGAEELIASARVAAQSILAEIEANTLSEAGIAEKFSRVADIFGENELRWQEAGALQQASELWQSCGLLLDSLRAEERLANHYARIGASNMAIQRLAQLQKLASEANDARVIFGVYIVALPLMVSEQRFDDVEGVIQELRRFNHIRIQDICANISRMLLECGEIERAGRIVSVGRKSVGTGQINGPLNLALILLKINKTGKMPKDGWGDLFPDQQAKARCEFLSGQPKAAISTLEILKDKTIEPKTKVNIEFSLLRCRHEVLVQFQNTNELNDFGNLTDRGDDIRELSRRALDSLSRNKPVDAIPLLHRALAICINEGDWSRLGDCHRYLAIANRVALRTRLAVFHAILGADEKQCDDISDWIVELSSPEQFSEAISACLDSRFSRSFPLVALVLCKMMPYASPREAEAVFKWSLSMTKNPWLSFVRQGVSKDAWKLLYHIQPHASLENAEDLGRTALAKPFAKLPWQIASKMLETLQKWATLFSNEMSWKLAQHLIDRYKRPNHVDPRDVFETVVSLCEKLPLESRQAVADRIAIQGEPFLLDHLDLLQKMGRTLIEEKGIQLAVKRTISNLERTVQILPKGQVPITPDVVGMHTSEEINGIEINVWALHSGWLRAICNCWPVLTPRLRKRAVVTIASLAINPNNMLSNRRNLMQWLCLMTGEDPSIDLGPFKKEFLKMARGQTVRDSEVERFRSSQDPLERYKLNFGDPESVRIEAFYLIGVLGSKGMLSKNQVCSEVSSAMSDPAEMARLGALNCILAWPEILSEFGTNIVTAMLSNSKDIRSEAFRCLNLNGLRFPSELQNLICTALADLSNSPDSLTRQWVFLIAKKYRDIWRSLGPNRLAAICNKLEKDMDVRVRRIPEKLDKAS